MEKKIIIRNIDVLKGLKDYPDNYFDGLLSDPPYGLGKIKNPIEFIQEWIQEGTGKVNDKDFMGKDWELPPPIIWKEVYRVLKPGAHLLVYAGSRVQDLMGLSLRLAGFDITDSFLWLFGAGFPKSLSIDKSIDKMAGVDREVVGSYHRGVAMHPGNEGIDNWRENYTGNVNVTAPATDEAKKFAGYGTALKPAYEIIILAMKPLSEKTYAENVKKWGTGALNINSSRIGISKDVPFTTSKHDNYPSGQKYVFKNEEGKKELHSGLNPNIGRWPANLLLTHHLDCKLIGTEKIKPTNGSGITHGKNATSIYGDKKSPESKGNEITTFLDENGEETIEQWECHPDCPIGQLNESVGIKKSGDILPHHKHIALKGNGITHGIMKAVPSIGYGDEGYVSRFFYNGKVSSKERSIGVEGIESNHPTMKPIKLNQYLSNLIRPPYREDGEPLRLLNLFAGTCSEAIGAYFAGWQEIVCIERDLDYTNIAKARVGFWTQFDSYEKAIDEGGKDLSAKKKTESLPALF